MEVIGRERFNQQSAYVEFVESGAQIAFSSDTTSMYEFNRSNPFLGIQVGHTRVDPQYPMDPDKYEDSIMPMAEQKISLDALLKGFTIEGAKQMHWEDKIGSLKKGKMANFIVLSENIFEVPKDKIIDINVLASVFEGKLIKGNL